MVEGGRSNLLLDTSVLNVLAAAGGSKGKVNGFNLTAALELPSLSVTFGLFVTSVQTAGAS